MNEYDCCKLITYLLNMKANINADVEKRLPLAMRQSSIRLGANRNIVIKKNEKKRVIQIAKLLKMNKGIVENKDIRYNKFTKYNVFLNDMIEKDYGNYFRYNNHAQAQVISQSQNILHGPNNDFDIINTSNQIEEKNEVVGSTMRKIKSNIKSSRNNLYLVNNVPSDLDELLIGRNKSRTKFGSRVYSKVIFCKETKESMTTRNDNLATNEESMKETCGKIHQALASSQSLYSFKGEKKQLLNPCFKIKTKQRLVPSNSNLSINLKKTNLFKSESIECVLNCFPERFKILDNANQDISSQITKQAHKRMEGISVIGKSLKSFVTSSNQQLHNEKVYNLVIDNLNDDYSTFMRVVSKEKHDQNYQSLINYLAKKSEAYNNFFHLRKDKPVDLQKSKQSFIKELMTKKSNLMKMENDLNRRSNFASLHTSLQK